MTKDKVIAELEKELESQIGGADFEINAMVATETMLREKLEEQIAYSKNVKVGAFINTAGSCSCCTKAPDIEMHDTECKYRKIMEVIGSQPSPQLLNKLKADSVREAITNCENKQCDDIHWSDILLEYADKLEKGE